MKITVLNNQSLFDLSIQTTGSVKNALELAQINNLNPSDFLTAGEELTIPNDLISNKDVLNYYSTNGLFPATGLNKEQLDNILGCEGIECWVINAGFIVS